MKVRRPEIEQQPSRLDFYVTVDRVKEFLSAGSLLCHTTVLFVLLFVMSLAHTRCAERRLL